MNLKKFSFLFLILGSILPFFTNRVFGQSEMILIREVIDYNQFEQIRDFIIENGDKKEYCINTGMVPHFSLDNSDFFLVSFSGEEMPEKEDYTVLYYVADFDNRRLNFYLTISDTKNIYLYDYKNMFWEATIRQRALRVIKTGITQILSEIEKV